LHGFQFKVVYKGQIM